MTQAIAGIHHVTALAVDPQANIDFYTGVLGLRLVKETVNFDDPGVYHFYYGDSDARPGSILTFFPFTMAARGRTGTGMVDVVAFAAPAASLEGWVLRLIEHRIEFDGPHPRFGQTMIAFEDPDGLKLEIIGRDDLSGDELAGFDGVTLCVEAPERTAALLTGTFGYSAAEEEYGRRRYRAQPGGARIGTNIDILCQPEAMRRKPGGGTVHHVAFRARDNDELAAWREAVAALGFNVTPVLDRKYFHSIYFREPGGILFEIATDPPGFTIDEAPDRLGTGLMLPPWLEARREQIVQRLPLVRLPGAVS